MRANDLADRYRMARHIENGRFVCCHYADDSGNRPASGSIYYHVSPGERTAFHKIDCDEYWIFNTGSTLELWIIGLDGKVRTRRLGIEEGSDPSVYLKSGEIFASRLCSGAEDGTFLTCITVPRFSEKGFVMYERDEIISICPDAAGFWAEF